MKKIDIESIFLSLIGSTDKLHWYLKDNINVVNYLYNVRAGQMAVIDLTLAFIPKSKKFEMLKEFNTDRILGILKRQRLNIYNILISHHNGRLWLENQIFNFKQHFLK